MRILKSIIATIILVLVIISLYEPFAKLYFSNWLASLQTSDVIKALLNLRSYRLINLAAIIAYGLSLLNIWVKGE